MNVALFGLGEAGGLIGVDLVAAGVTVAGYDPAPVATPPGVQRYANPAAAAAIADVVVALTPAADAEAALRQGIAAMPAGALYADWATSSARLKARLAATAAQHGIAFADVALLSIIPGNGLRVAALASGSGADRFVELFRPLGMPVDAIGPNAGDAATRKLLRSVMMKGLAAVVIEAMRAGEAAGCAGWLWDNLAAELTAADAHVLARLVSGTERHAIRRLHEMEASCAMLEELGVDPLMTRATVESLRRVPTEGVPQPR